MSIVIKELTHVYSPRTPFEKTALDKVSFTIEDGDYFGIIGHTGSGKSTLISHLNGLIKLTGGSIVVNGIDLSKKYDYKKLRSEVGMVFQYPEYQLFDETVERDVAFGPKNMGLSASEIADRVEYAIKLVGLDYDKIKNRSPFELSGGQMRRVALAGVLAMRPKILVLDEPTAGLDPRGKKEILDLTLKIKEHCPTVIMISHNMDEIAAYCNRIAVLGGGKLEGVFTPRELFGRSDLIERMGLSLPTAALIAKKLRDRGVQISASDEDELVSAILNARRASHA
ncbi:MAG: energy-coupling factor transporter ATPase [Clostridia bacterium]|nr:energy-coupling factor transporter ATPase [Clostridia bacterium]